MFVNRNFVNKNPEIANMHVHKVLYYNFYSNYIFLINFVSTLHVPLPLFSQ